MFSHCIYTQTYLNILLCIFYKSDAEYKAMYLSYDVSKPHNHTVKMFDATSYDGYIPEYIDWRTMNAVTPVKKQVFVYTNKHIKHHFTHLYVI